MTRTLYICYFGIREPLVRTQVLPYLREIAKDDVEVSILTFEPDLAGWDKREIEDERQRLALDGIDWHYLAYHKTPSVPATVYDIWNGARYVRSLIAKRKFDVIHCRVHVAAVMGELARRSSRLKPKLIFDIRGFFPEEYTDAGIWPANGSIYRSVKKVERWLLRSSDAFVVLTEKAREILFPGSAETHLDERQRPIAVIPCCVDLKRFAEYTDGDRQSFRAELGITDRRVLVYVGSFGGWYLTEETLELFVAAKRRDPRTFVMVLTQRDVDKAAAMLRERGFAGDDMIVCSVSPQDIPRYLNAADVGISFIKNCYSKQASSPTKNAEYLAARLPIIANAGIGDVDEQITSDRVGVIVHDLNAEGYTRALAEIEAMGDIRDRCRESAQRRFDLETVGGPRYRDLYRRLLGG